MNYYILTIDENERQLIATALAAIFIKAPESTHAEINALFDKVDRIQAVNPETVEGAKL